MNNSKLSLQKRMLLVFMLIAFVFVVVFFRLGHIQLISGNWLQAMVMEQWMRDLPINASRGLMYDINGNLLATNYSTFDVYVRGSMVKNSEQVARVLHKYLGVSYEVALEKAKNRSVGEVLIKLQVEESVAKAIIAEKVSGILLSENSKRYYPYGDLLTQVLGYTTIDNVGQSALETYYNRYLTGVNGYVLNESDVKGVQIEGTLEQYIPSIAGQNLNLTIDVNIQIACENALRALVEAEKPKSATMIVMNPNTGAIVAMATKPSFNLNNIPRNDIATLLETSKNLAIVDVYEPGSTFKVLTTAAALEEGVTTELERFYDPGYRIVDGQRIKCWKLTGHGSQTMEEGLCNSCNSVFVDLALRLGKDRMYEYFDKFGFGQQLGIDFFAESAGILLDKDRAETVDVARMGFGQAIALTPIQLVTAVSSVLNGGRLMQPYFVESISDVNGKVMHQHVPTVLNRTVSENTSARICSMMEKVITKSNGINAFIPGYRVSGKTGTSQKYEDGKIVQKFISSFVGAFPADNPDYVVLVVADEPAAGNYYGSIVATPYAKMVFEYIIGYKNYPAHNLEEDTKRMEKTISMPALYGKSLTEAVTILNSLNLQCEVMGEGGVVISQTPTEGTMVHERAIVVLET